MLRFAAENIDCATCQIVVSKLVREQWSSFRIGDESPGFVTVKCPLERPYQQIALGSVVIDDTQPAVTAVILRCEILARLCDIGNLSANNEVFALLDFSELDLVHVMHGERLANAGL